MKSELDRLRPLSPRALANLDHAYDVELTYTSNAIEGNTLTQVAASLGDYLSALREALPASDPTRP